jgi:hypothetical protein
LINVLIDQQIWIEKDFYQNPTRNTEGDKHTKCCYPMGKRFIDSGPNETSQQTNN